MGVLKGVYVLAIPISQDIVVEVGSIGSVYFKKGVYAYVGSAQNSLEKRLMRHFQGAQLKFWHIDYLLARNSPILNLVTAFYKEAEKQEECATAQKFSKFAFSIKCFGCSDCNCQSHLFRFENFGFLEDLCLANGFLPFHLASESLH